jgi:aminotransferase EvaB
MNVGYSYLDRQFDEIEPYLDDIRTLVRSGDFTLGSPVQEFEEKFADLCGLPYAVGVGSGTDALALSLKAAGVGPGDEVVTTPNTFVASVGAIVMTGATPVFVDNDEEYNIDVNQIETAIGPKTKALMPVHLTGSPANMPVVMEIANRYNLPVVEDAAQAILASIDGVPVVSWGVAAGFSLHPLKNLNVWGDSGVIVTKSKDLADQLRLLRNHGLATRDEITVFGHNSRLDSIQAVVANRLLKQVHTITDKRIEISGRYDQSFADLEDLITIPPRRPGVKQVYHTYVIQAKNRDGLLKHLLKNGVDAKVHYPIPLHLQKAAEYLQYKKGDFPVCERHCENIITLPAHQHLTDDEIGYVIENVRGFYLN